MSELEEFLLFSIMVAGKNAKQTANKLDSFLYNQRKFGVNDFTPLQYVNFLDRGELIPIALKSEKIGQYNRLTKALKGILQFYGQKLRSVSVDELESVDGIGSKTARFFVLHTQPNTNYAVLDTHILAWLRDHGIDAPKSTPTKSKYKELEKKFLSLAKQYGINPAELDLQIWKSYSKKPKTRKKKKWKMNERL